MRRGGWDLACASSASLNIFCSFLGFFVRWRVPPSFGVARKGLLGPSVGPSISLECRWHISRCPVAFDALCCVKPIVLRRCGDMRRWGFKRGGGPGGGGGVSGEVGGPM